MISAKPRAFKSARFSFYKPIQLRRVMLDELCKK